MFISIFSQVIIDNNVDIVREGYILKGVILGEIY